MGALKSALEFAGPAYKDQLGRHEAHWKYEPISSHSVPVYGTQLPEGLRRTLARELVRPVNGRSLQPYSKDENVALSAGLVARFKAWNAYRESIARYDLESADEDFQWQQDTLDSVERIMQGYVNLICAVNFDFRTNGEVNNLDRVEEFLEDERDAVISAFENQGGRQAFSEKTSALPTSSRAGSAIYENLATSDLEIDPTFSTGLQDR